MARARAYKVNLILTKKQEKILKDHATASRLIFNDVKRLRDQRYENWIKTYPQITKQLKSIFQKKISYTDVKNFSVSKSGEIRSNYFVRPWMKKKKIASYAMREAVEDVYNAYKNFFDGLGKYPKYKNKKSLPKFRIAQPDGIKLIPDNTGKFTNHIKLTNIGILKLERNNYIPFQLNSPPIIGNKKVRGKQYPIYEFDIIQAALSYKAGKWQISVSMYVDDKKVKLKSEIHGADVGSRTIFSLATKDNSYHKEYNLRPEIKVKLDKLERKLKMWQKKMSRREVKGTIQQSQGWFEAKYEVQRLHEKIVNLREDSFHKITNNIVQHKPDQINAEKLSVKNMQKNKKLSPTLQKAGLYKIGLMLRYKAKWMGIKMAEYNPINYASTQLCSNCPAQKGKNGLKKQGSSKVYFCKICGLKIDRDHNSAIVSAQAPQEVLNYLT